MCILIFGTVIGITALSIEDIDNSMYIYFGIGIFLGLSVMWLAMMCTKAGIYKIEKESMVKNE
jgi:hypothetical protein